LLFGLIRARPTVSLWRIVIDGAGRSSWAGGRHMTFEKPLDLDEFLANPIWV
jgi:hypothetical protein